MSIEVVANCDTCKAQKPTQKQSYLPQLWYEITYRKYPFISDPKYDIPNTKTVTFCSVQCLKEFDGFK